MGPEVSTVVKTTSSIACRSRGLAAQEQRLDCTLGAEILVFSSTSTTAPYSSVTNSFPIRFLEKVRSCRAAWGQEEWGWREGWVGSYHTGVFGYTLWNLMMIHLLGW